MAVMSGRVAIVGTGLIGTSIGMALRDVADVLLDDVDDATVEAAVSRGAGRRWDRRAAVDLVVVCAPPAATGRIVNRLLRSTLTPTVSHVASAQARVQHEVERLAGPDVSLLRRFCGGHPLAGRETRGPSAASARLFVDRPWAVCAGPTTDIDVLGAVRWLAEACGAVPVEIGADAHDAAVALVSHLPQLAASALAAQLDAVGGSSPDPDTAGAATPGHAGPKASAPGPDAYSLAGPGLQDTTRIAASDAELWVDILTSNAAQVAPLVHDLAADLAGTARHLDRLAAGGSDAPAAADALRDLLLRGARGRARLPLKRRAETSAFVPVLVSVRDRPGQIAGVLACAAEAGVNVEDVRVEHLPGRPRGLVELLVRAADRPAAREALSVCGWELLED
ncbi:MAG TPA: prephenate dehydrogenase/arogenate dehydrogenase family protein [Mycobacteriales bacterium]|nr:prephenate dehydrogenase/arogenate dehydrogenase family protein [Mycobacteriales bacterium]